jgi:hypothetical protein
MNKQSIISVIVLFIVSMLLGFAIHGALLADEYMALPDLFRPEAEAQNYFMWMILAHVSMAIGLTWVYRMGKEDKPWLAQGIRFGIAIAVLMTIPIYLIYYAVQPLPEMLVIRQISYDGIGSIIMGIVLAFVNK